MVKSIIRIVSLILIACTGSSVMGVYWYNDTDKPMRFAHTWSGNEKGNLLIPRKLVEQKRFRYIKSPGTNYRFDDQPWENAEWVAIPANIQDPVIIFETDNNPANTVGIKVRAISKQQFFDEAYQKMVKEAQKQIQESIPLPSGVCGLIREYYLPTPEVGEVNQTEEKQQAAQMQLQPLPMDVNPDNLSGTDIQLPALTGQKRKELSSEKTTENPAKRQKIDE